MADSPGGSGQADESDPPEFAAEPQAGSLQAEPQAGSLQAEPQTGSLQAGRVPATFGRTEERLFHARQVVADEERLADLRQQEVDSVVAALNDRTPAELAGVDTSVLKQVDPEFDDEAFRAIARETFAKVREARRLQNPQEPAELLSPQMQSELQDAISGDVAAHRHHLLPFLSVKDAVIAGARLADGHEEIDVQFSISSGEEDRDDRTGQIVAGDDTERSWEERWRFTRDPQADTSASDERHEITFVRTDQWMVAHRGWLVTEITRLPDS